MTKNTVLTWFIFTPYFGVKTLLSYKSTNHISSNWKCNDEGIGIFTMKKYDEFY